MTAAGLIIAIIFFILGFAGTLLPLLPGAPLIWGGMLVYGLFTDFTSVSWQFLGLQGIIVVLITLVDYVSGAWGADRYGGSRYSIWGSIVGGLVGIIIFGPIGVILGPFLGAMLAEMLGGKPWDKALKIGWGTIVGFLGGTLIKFLMELIMVIWFFSRILT